MNDKDRYKVMMRTRDMLETISAYKAFLEKLKATEENKSENVPEALLDATGIEDNINSIDDAIAMVEEANNNLEEIPSILDLKIRKKRERRIDTTFPFLSNDFIDSKEKRSVRLQLLTTPSLEKKFKHFCKLNNVSLNEAINVLMTKAINEEN